ncbi:MAG: MerR family transcriptional regulator [Bacteriovorax sp.]|jgi:DNA-binding transcriptional MerR regulator|nr:MerR family transcriptional regulator [Bacteriovorax sp.]
MSEPIEIPNKSSFKINEVCALTGVKSYVLRFWESEFSEIDPLVSSAGLKLYEHKDIEAILLIKKLLFDDKLSIERARMEMKILMPKGPLVEAAFDDCVDEDNYFEDKTILSSVPQTKRVLIETDIQKLVMAKAKLTKILSLTESLHHKNNW